MFMASYKNLIVFYLESVKWNDNNLFSAAFTASGWSSFIRKPIRLRAARHIAMARHSSISVLLLLL